MIQCLLYSVGFSQCQKVLDQGWRVWKTLTRYGVWSQEIKLVEKGEREKERKKSLEDVSSSFHTPLQTAQDFSGFTTECSRKKMKICHVTPKSRRITVSLVRIQMITHFLSFSGALSYHPLSYCILKRTTWSSILVVQSKPRQCPF